MGCHLIGACNPQTKGKGFSLLSASPALSRFFACEDCALHCSTTFNASSALMACLDPCRWLPARSSPQFLRWSACGSRLTCQVLVPRCMSSAEASTSKAPSSTVGTTCRRYLFPGRRSGHCAPACICCEFVNDTQHVSPAIVPASLVA